MPADSNTTPGQMLGGSAAGLSREEITEVLRKLEPWTLPVDFIDPDASWRVVIITSAPISDETKAYFERLRLIGMKIVYQVRDTKEVINAG